MLIVCLLFSIVKGATLCTSTAHTNADFPLSLFVPECSSTGFKITIDETCRAAEYSFIDFGTSTFVDGVITQSTMPASPGSTCIPAGSTGSWVYTVAFSECNIGAATVLTNPDSDGINYNEYTLYLNYDNAIATSQGVGFLQALGQTAVKCRVPQNLQENAVAGQITITDGDYVPDQTGVLKFWEEIQLDVHQGGSAATATWSPALAPGSSIELGEHVKLEVNNQGGGSILSSWNVAINECWASSEQNIRDNPVDGNDDDTGGIDFDATGANINGLPSPHKTVKFYEGMCPKFAWVGPIYGTSGNNVGEVTPVGVNTNPSVTLRQFAFNDGAGGLSNSFYYHCEINICASADACVNQALDCAATADQAGYAPTGRRKRAVNNSITGIITTKRFRRENSDGGANSPTFTTTGDCPQGQTLTPETSDENVFTCQPMMESSEIIPESSGIIPTFGFALLFICLLF